MGCFIFILNPGKIGTDFSVSQKGPKPNKIIRQKTENSRNITEIKNMSR